MAVMGQKESSLVSYLPVHSTNAVPPLCGQQAPGSPDRGITKKESCMHGAYTPVEKHRLK